MTDMDDKGPKAGEESQSAETPGKGATAEAPPANAAPDVEAPAATEASDDKVTANDRPPIPPPLSRERRQRRSRAVVAILVLVAILAGVTGAFWMAGWEVRDGRIVRPAVTPAGTSPATLPDVAALATRIDRMTSDIKALQERPFPLPVDDTRLTSLERQIKDLSAALARVESGVKAEASQPRGPDPSALSLLALTAALDAGRPFAAHLDGARAALTGLGTEGQARLAALDRISGYAATGVPTAAMLAARATAVRRLAATASAETAAPAAPPPAETLWGRIKERIGGLVTVRRIDDGSAPGKKAAAGRDDPATPFAMAARLLAEGKIAEAEGALGTAADAALPPPARDAAGTLAADVAARRAADRIATGAVMVPPAMGSAKDR